MCTRCVTAVTVLGSVRLGIVQPTDRVHPTHYTRVHVVQSRQTRPNTATDITQACPFCVGGLESPEPYDTRWFVNRWPTLSDDRCEVLLYSSQHDASLATLPIHAIRTLIDMWVERTRHHSACTDVATVLIFENRGTAVGATINHPHGQLYAFDHVPQRSQQRLNWTPPMQSDLSVSQHNDWNTAVPFASEYPVALEIWPTKAACDMMSLSTEQLDGLALTLRRIVGVLDAMYQQPLPYMMWINQRDFSSDDTSTQMNIEIVSPWRDAGVMRYIAAAEVSTGEYFNPVVPEELAATLRGLFTRAN